MSYGYTNNRPALLKRLRRAEGQVRGVAKMIEEDTYCIDILTQINALQAAVDKVALELLRSHAAHCLNYVKDETEQQKKIDELVTATGRLLSR